jgi:hypothetical protein
MAIWDDGKDVMIPTYPASQTIEELRFRLKDFSLWLRPAWKGRPVNTIILFSYHMSNGLFFFFWTQYYVSNYGNGVKFYERLSKCCINNKSCNTITISNNIFESHPWNARIVKACRHFNRPIFGRFGGDCAHIPDKQSADHSRTSTLLNVFNKGRVFFHFQFKFRTK